MIHYHGFLEKLKTKLCAQWIFLVKIDTHRFDTHKNPRNLNNSQHKIHTGKYAHKYIPAADPDKCEKAKLVLFRHSMPLSPTSFRSKYFIASYFSAYIYLDIEYESIQ